jgi:hypothetical protein
MKLFLFFLTFLNITFALDQIPKINDKSLLLKNPKLIFKENFTGQSMNPRWIIQEVDNTGKCLTLKNNILFLNTLGNEKICILHKLQNPSASLSFSFFVKPHASDNIIFLLVTENKPTFVMAVIFTPEGAMMVRDNEGVKNSKFTEIYKTVDGCLNPKKFTKVRLDFTMEEYAVQINGKKITQGKGAFLNNLKKDFMITTSGKADFAEMTLEQE